MLPSAIMTAGVGVFPVVRVTGLYSYTLIIFSWSVPDQQPCKDLLEGLGLGKTWLYAALGGSSRVNFTSVTYFTDKETQTESDNHIYYSFRGSTLELQASLLVWNDERYP